MNKEIKLTLADVYIGYACTALIMYAIGGIAYNIGKTKGKAELSEKINDFVDSYHKRDL